MKVATVAFVLAIAGAVVCGGVALHEWDYRSSHPYGAGVAGVLVWLAIGAGLGCLSIAALAWSGRKKVPDPA